MRRRESMLPARAHTIHVHFWTRRLSDVQWYKSHPFALCMAVPHGIGPKCNENCYINFWELMCALSMRKRNIECAHTMCVRGNEREWRWGVTVSVERYLLFAYMYSMASTEKKPCVEGRRFIALKISNQIRLSSWWSISMARLLCWTSEIRSIGHQRRKPR